MKLLPFLVLFLTGITLSAQDYFLNDFGPYDPAIPSPESFLDYPIGSQHTRHDRIVAYLTRLAELSDKSTLTEYGKTHEGRKLVIYTVTNKAHLDNLDAIQKRHIEHLNPQVSASVDDLPVFINLGYNVHGNEPSSSEAALLTAYILTASNHPIVEAYRKSAVIFIDPTINPDGRDRHTQWANMMKGSPLVADPLDIEHNERWPSGRTNHYWFDLNRDWLLAIHPESRGKLRWYHQWYPNVITDFHEMGSNSSYFFEPMKDNGSKDPIMPKENYTTLNNTFARYYEEALNNIGSFYFTREVFDGTYPGYGSSYPDLQGGLGILFEQASSRGHVQNTRRGKLTFAFTIRNQLTSSMATVKAAVENKDLLYSYQKDFFKSAISRANASRIKAYVFGDSEDDARNRAFLDKLLLHQIEVYQLKSNTSQDGNLFRTGKAFVVPTAQPQYRMVQTMFETYKAYTDSVFYDASAWSLPNFYNVPYASLSSTSLMGKRVTRADLEIKPSSVEKAKYAYLVDGNDYGIPGFTYRLQQGGARVYAAFKPFTINTHLGNTSFDYGSLVIPVSSQEIGPDSLHRLITSATMSFDTEVFSASTGFSGSGVDLGSRYIAALTPPKALTFVEYGVSAYEAGEVWHLLDKRVNMPITKVPIRNFNRINWDDYNVLILVSGSYSGLDSTKIASIKAWVSKGNTLITIRQGSSWAIKKKLVKESLVKSQGDNKKDKNSSQKVVRKPYVEAPENIGKQAVGGAIFQVDLDLTHPLAFGYTRRNLPVYRNSTVWLQPSKSPYGTVAAYTENPHIDGFITRKNLNLLKKSASLIVSPVGRGRVVMFAENPNFRGSWFGTNRLFLNAIFLGEYIDVPND